MKKFYAGDSCIIFELDNKISPEISSKVLYLYGNLRRYIRGDFSGITDIVPSYKSVAVHFNPYYNEIENLSLEIEKEIYSLLEKYTPENEIIESESIEIPVIYDGEDLKRISSMNNIPVNKIIEMHSSGKYRVAMIGFKPYFPYLLGLDPSLAVARLESPRKLVPAGSVAIGGEQTGIYPEDSPGGWNIIGRTDPEILKSINPGDLIFFRRVETL